MLGLLASLAFATSGPFGRTLLELGWTPGTAVFWRTFGGGLVLLPLGLWAVRGRWSLLRTEWRLIVAFGVFGVTMAQALFFGAVARMSVSIALLIEYAAPVALVLWAWARSRRRPSRLVLAGSGAAILGLVCVLDLTGARPDALGLLFAAGSMFGAAGYFVLSARRTELPPVTLAAAGLLTGSVLLGVLSLTGVLPYAAPLGMVSILGNPTPWWVSLGVVIVASTAIAYGLGITGIALMGERLGSFVSLSEVVFATLLAAVMLAELPSPIQLLGGGLIVAGVVAIRLSNTGPPVVAEPAAAEDTVRESA